MSVPLSGRELHVRLATPELNATQVLSLVWFYEGLQYHLEGQGSYHRSAVTQTREKFKELMLL